MILKIKFLQQNFKCVVKTAPNMKLDHLEVRVFAYVFQEDLNTGQVVLRMYMMLFSLP